VGDTEKPQFEFGSRSFRIIVELNRSISSVLLVLRRIFETHRRRDEDKSGSNHEAIIRADEYFLLCASAKVLRWLDIAVKENLVPDDLKKDFAAIERPLKDARDMREHSEDYNLGKGKFPERFIHEDEISGYKVPADWTFVHKDRYLIGGRVELSELAIAVRKLFKSLQSSDLWFLPWSDLGLDEYGPLPD
jgi:hypothetical protein